MTNEELKLIEEIKEYLSELRGSKVMYFSFELDKIYYKYTQKKKDLSKKANDYNKRHKKRHLIINQISYHRKRNNQAKVKELIKKLEGM